MLFAWNNAHGAVAAAVVVLFALALLSPATGAHWCRRLLETLEPLARRPWLAVSTCAALAFFGSMAVAVFARWPEPAVHDEFSYLLAADTFASGRLANPTHPLWHHFETFHVIHEPAYASKYPPGQGLVLALGQVVGGHPLVGVWFSAALMCAALCWMFYAWLPPRWALLGGLVAAMHLGVATYWSQSYWGGAVAASGGAFVFGALPRVVRGGRALDGALLGLGLGVLALARPYEGLIASLPAAVVLLAWIARGGRRGVVLRTLLPLVVVLGAVLVWLGMYHAAVTGSPFRMPYAVHDAAYVVAPPFLWIDSAPVPAYRHDELREFWTGWALERYVEQRTPLGFLADAAHETFEHARFYLGFLAVALATLPAVLRRRWMRFAFGTCGLVLVVSLASTYHMAHYVAPVTGAVLVLAIAGLRHVCAWRWRGARAGRSLVLAVLACAALVVPIHTAFQRSAQHGWWDERARILRELEADDERHLVVVRYGELHSEHYEWIANEADIDAAEVLWARDMGPELNRRLLESFDDRRCWRLDVGFPGEAVSLREYSR